MPRRGGCSPAAVSGCRRRSSACPALEREGLTVYWQWRSTRDRWSKLGASGTGRQVDQLRAAVVVDGFTAVPAARLTANRVQVVARRRVALDAVRHAALALPPPTVDCAIVHKFTLICWLCTISVSFHWAICPQVRWLSSRLVRESSTGRGFLSRFFCRATQCNFGQVVYTHVPLSPSTVIWYRPMDGDDRRLGSKPRPGGN